MERTRVKEMSKGAILFAHNTAKTDYYAMAIATAKRINHFLDLPVTVITDPSIDPDSYEYKFDKTLFVEADTSNKKAKDVWINKGRFKAWEMSPYDETLVLDTDYMVNSNQLSTVFNLYDDFCTHNTTSFMMVPNAPQERISNLSFNTLANMAV